MNIDIVCMNYTKKLLTFRGDNKYFVSKLICENLGRILLKKQDHFQAKLNYDQHKMLVKDIEKRFFIRVDKTKRYTNYGDLCTTFTVIK